MRLTDVLDPSRIRVPLEGRSKTDVFRELLDLVPLPDAETRDAVLKAVVERENTMSTGIGSGIALPHGIVDRRVPFSGVLGIADAPLPWEASDGQPVSLVFLLVADRNEPGTHIKALARITRLLHREAFRKALMDCRTPEDALRVIRDEEARHKI